MNNMEIINNQMGDIRSFFNKVYLWMCFGLVLSGLTAYVVSSNENLYGVFISNSLFFYILLFVELALVLLLIYLIKKISVNLAKFLFFLYCFTTGLTLSVVFLVYTYSSISMVFFITAGMFGFMSLYGYKTKKDLTQIGQILTMFLFGIIIASLINLFLHNPLTDYLVSIIGVVVFVGLTAYDTQKIKTFYVASDGVSDNAKKSIIGALTLYLDFINLFLKLLRLFGKKRN